jgi:hypothetical protein
MAEHCIAWRSMTYHNIACRHFTVIINISMKIVVTAIASILA